MRTRLPHLLFASFSIALLAAACGAGTPSGKTGSVVLGIASKLQPGVAIDTLHVVLKAGGDVVGDETLTSAGKDLVFPTELRADDLDDGELVTATIEGSSGGKPLIERVATTEALGGKELLLRVDLAASCLGAAAPTCLAPKTCNAGACVDSHVAGASLPAYKSDWATTTTTVDICKPQNAGDPIVVVGQGQADYLPLADGDVAQIEAGPQGGHHIWVAVRLKNLTQSGSITSLTGHLPELGYDVGPFNVIFTFDPDEGGYCKIYGLRFQLDTDHDIQEMLGKTLELQASIKDKDGDVGVGKRTIKLSDTILGQ
jgi:hypothetical protein